MNRRWSWLAVLLLAAAACTANDGTTERIEMEEPKEEAGAQPVETDPRSPRHQFSQVQEPDGAVAAHGVEEKGAQLHPPGDGLANLVLLRAAHARAVPGAEDDPRRGRADPPRGLPGPLNRPPPGAREAPVAIGWSDLRSPENPQVQRASCR